ncbi:MAG: DAK2 domain-containing protein [Limnochordales bacterium]|nr:DAK2 domain-containing protein [Limnochordales bacterium]
MRYFKGSHFRAALAAGLKRLEAEKEVVNALNVFPVPDGDTGTNMYLTAARAVEEVARVPDERVDVLAQAAARGALVGARGNSGVILSQFFRGFAQGVGKLAELSAWQLARALRQASETAYKAVMRPVEGTMLSVGRAIAQSAERLARDASDWETVVRGALKSGQQALLQTTQQLPQLRQAGVVDAGAQGLVLLFEGLVLVADGKAEEVEDRPGEQEASAAHILAAARAGVIDIPDSAETGLARPPTGIVESEITYGYCTEFLLLGPESHAAGYLREQLERLGDSILVVESDGILKIHVHTNHPGRILELALSAGKELLEVHINNMREQNRQAAARNSRAGDNGVLATATHLDAGTNHHLPVHAGTAPGTVATPTASAPAPAFGGEEIALETARTSVVAVANGEGIRQILRSLGVAEVVSGGQTMNPSAQELLEAVERAPGREVILLPNNSNVVMTARQAAELSSKVVYVVPTRSVPQGIGSLLSFRPDLPGAENEKLLTQAAAKIRTGEVTYAVRDAEHGRHSIRAGDYLALRDGELVGNGPDLVKTTVALLEQLVQSPADCITLYTGEGVDRTLVRQVEEAARALVPEGEVDVYEGGQPLYYFLIAVE